MVHTQTDRQANTHTRKIKSKKVFLRRNSVKMFDKKQCENTYTHSRRGQEKVLDNRTPGARRENAEVSEGKKQQQEVKAAGMAF